jgi:hypothetical protein
MAYMISVFLERGATVYRFFESKTKVSFWTQNLLLVGKNSGMESPVQAGLPSTNQQPTTNTLTWTFWLAFRRCHHRSPSVQLSKIINNRLERKTDRQAISVCMQAGKSVVVIMSTTEEPVIAAMVAPAEATDTGTNNTSNNSVSNSNNNGVPQAIVRMGRTIPLKFVPTPFPVR